ncbi:MAG: 30S ribosomal protein S6 [Patescibacteria group bacterium]|nr:30S ribosomal protein S6 [Patescibacteria group bacterium]MCL5432159.1 30S ribosomal protein S6 [Patescibacteria group bacterium]
MRDYELTVLLAPTLTQKELDKAVKDLTDLIADQGAKIKSKKDPAKKPLAYEVGKQREAFYLYFEVSMAPDKVSTVDKKLRLMDNVLRHLLVNSKVKI